MLIREYQVVEFRPTLMPDGARILFAKQDGEDYVLFALVDEGKILVERKFKAFNTEEFLPSSSMVYVNSFLRTEFNSYSRMMHVFEVF